MGRGQIRQKVYNCHHPIVHMSVIMEKPAEHDVVAEKVSIVDCYIKRKKVVMDRL